MATGAELRDLDGTSVGDLRLEIRDWLDRELPPDRRSCLGMSGGHDPAFSRKLGKAGWLGLSVPVRYGGHNGTAVQRFIVTEELLVAQAPVGAHWLADRQVAPSILRVGTEEQRRTFLPAIVRGETYFSIGLSEPEAGSDLSAVRTQARRVAAVGEYRARRYGPPSPSTTITCSRCVERSPAARTATAVCPS